MANKQQVDVNLSFTADTQQVKTQLEELQRSLNNLTKNAGKDRPLGITSEITEAIGKVTQLQSILQKATTSTGKLDLGQFKQELNRANLDAEKLSTTLANFGTEGQVAFSNLAKAVSAAEMPLKKTNSLLQEFAISLKNTAKWMISSSLLHGFVGGIQKAVGYTEDLNKSLNNIRIVTGQSTDQMAKFAKEANAAAKALSTTTTAYTDASLIFYQQGLTGDAVKERTDTVIKLSNVTGEAVQDVSSYMTAIWNNFADGSESLEHYADVITALGAATASSSAEIAEGLEKFAAIGQTVGLSYDYATAALATVVANTRQSANTVGNAFKTIFARMQSLKLGETLEDDVDLTKYSKALAAVGVQVIDTNGELKDLDSILNDLADKWVLMADAQKSALAQTVAGTRQYAQFIALMENWEEVQQNVLIAQGSEGTLQKQADTYAEGWEGARKRVQAAWQGIYTSILDDKFFISLNDSLANVLNGVKTIITSFGGLKGLLPGIAALLLKMFGPEMANNMRNFATNLSMTFTPQKYQDKIIQTKQEFNTALINSGNDATPTGAAMADVYAQQGTAQNELINKTRELNAQNIKITEQEQLQLNLLSDIHKQRGEEYIEIIKEVEAIQNENDKLVEQINLFTSSNQDKIFKKGYDPSNFQQDLNDLNALQQGMTSLNHLVEQYSEHATLFGDASAAEGLRQTIKALQDLNPNLNIRGLDSYKKALDNLSKAANDGGPAVRKAFVAVLREATSVSREAAKATQDLTNNIKNNTKAGKQTRTMLNELGQGFEQIGNKQEEAAVSGSSLAQSYEQLLQQIREIKGTAPDVAEKLTAGMQGLASYGMVLSSIRTNVQSVTDAFMSLGDTTSNISLGDSLLSAFTSLSMMIPSFLATFSRLKTIMASTAVAEAKVALATNAETASIIKNNTVTSLNTLLSNKNGVAKGFAAFQYLLFGKNAHKAALEELVATKVIEEETVATELETAALIARNAAMTMGIGLAISAIAVGVGVASSISERTKKLREERIEQEKNNLELNKSKQEEIDKSKELVDSYNELLKSYKDGTITRNQLADSIQDLCDSYGIENGRLLILTDNYNKLTDSIRRYRMASLEEQKRVSESNKKNQTKLAQDEGFEGKTSVSHAYGGNGSRFMTVQEATQGEQTAGVSIDWTGAGWEEIYDDDTGELIGYSLNRDHGSDAYEKPNTIVGDLTSSEGILQYYSDLIEATTTLKDTKGEEDSEYKVLMGALNKIKPYAEEILSEEKKEILSQSEIDFWEQFESFNASDLSYEDFVTKYTKIIEDVESSAENLFNLGEITEEQKDFIISDSTKQLNDLINSYTQNSDLLRRKQVTDSFKDLFKDNKAVGNVEDWLEKNIYNDKNGLAILTHLQFDGTESQSEMDAALSVAKAQVKNELRTATTEALIEGISELGDKGTIDTEKFKEIYTDKGNDFWEQFDASSAIEQMRLLGELANEDIKKNHDAYEEEVKATQNNIRLYQQEKQALEEKIKAQENTVKAAQDNLDNFVPWGTTSSEEKEKDLEDQVDFAQKKLKELQDQLDILFNDYDINIDINIDDVLLDDLSLKVNQIVGSTDILVSGIKLIDEEFKVAKEDVHAFADAYPELLEKATVCADGSIQLNEEVVNAIKAGNLAVLKSDSEVTEKQLEDKITLLDAEIAFEESKLEILQELYQGTIDNEEGNQKLAAATEEYKTKLLNAFGDNYEKYLNELIDSDTDTTNLFLDNLDLIDKRIQEVSEHYSQMLNGEVVKASVSVEAIGGTANSFSHIEDAGQDVYSPLSDEQLREQYLEQISATKDTIKEKNKLRGTYTALLSDLRRGIDNLENVQYEGSNKSSSKTSKPSHKDKKEYTEELPDRYHDLNEAIEKVTHSMEMLDKMQDKLSGANLIASLKQENKLIEQQQKNYKKLGAELKTEQKELQSFERLGQFGATFNEDGTVSNYAEIFTKIEEQYMSAIETYNSAIDKYNNMTKEQQEAEGDFLIKQAEAELNSAKEFHDEAQDWLSRSDEVAKELRDLEEKYIEEQLKKIENNLKKWETKFQIKFDIQDAQRSITQFYRTINKDFTKMYKTSKDMTKEFSSYNKEANIDTETINDRYAESKKLAKIIENENYEYDGDKSLFANRDEAIKKYQEVTESLMDDVENLYQLYQDTWNAYLEDMDQILGKWDNLVERFDDINDKLDHYQKLSEMLYGTDSAFGMNNLNQIYNASAVNSIGKQTALRAEINSLETELEEILAVNGGKENQEDVQKIKDQIKAANKELDSEIENYLETIQNRLVNSIHSIMDTADKAMVSLGGSDKTNGLGLAKISERWQDAQAAAEGYYDDVQRVYQLEQLENKWNTALKDTKTAKNQQIIKNIMDAQLKNLEEKTELSEYDIKLAEKELEITKAQMALEEAKNNKNTMKLVRNEQGNWSYQYVADQEDLANKEQKVLDLLYDKYDFVKEANKKATEELLQLQQTAQERLTALMEEYKYADEERRAEIEEEYNYLVEYYYGEGGLIARKAGEAVTKQEDLNREGMNVLWGLYTQNEENYNNMTDKQKKLMDEVKTSGCNSFLDLTEKIATDDGSFYHQIEKTASEVIDETKSDWENIADDIIAAWGEDPDSVRSIVEDAYDDIQEKVDEYDGAIEESEEASEEAWSNIGDSVDEVWDQVDDLIDEIDDLEDETDDLSDFREEVEEIGNQFNEAKKKIKKATKRLEKFLNLLKEQTEYTISVKFDVEDLNKKLKYPKKITIPVEYNVTTTGNKNTSNKDLPEKKDTTLSSSGKSSYKIVAIDNKDGISKTYYFNTKEAADKAKSEMENEQTRLGYKVINADHQTVLGIYKTEREAKNKCSDYSGSYVEENKTNRWSNITGPTEYSSMATGGYTGEWGSEGKFAMLHEKELVLNKEDTSNILNAVTAVRELSGLGTSISNIVSQGIGNMVSGMFGIKAPAANGSQTVNNNGGNTFHIHAEFPNANSVAEIQEAILNLPNLASQYLSSQNHI